MPLFVFLLVLLLLSIRPLYSTSQTTSATTPSDALRSNGLPIGLLPKTNPVDPSRFAIDDAGRFTLRLPRGPCVASFDMSIRYDEEVSGVISYGQISSLSGVSAQELFLWLPVLLVRVGLPSSGLIYFDLGGVLHKQLALSMFETPPDCVPIQADRVVL